jgi:phosphohistidine swiveling domain-containing protein
VTPLEADFLGVGAGDATAVIRDGDVVEVDGAAGAVRIVR